MRNKLIFNTNNVMRNLLLVSALVLAHSEFTLADYDGNLTVKIFQNYSNDNGTLVTRANCCPVTGDGTPFSNLLGTFTSRDIMFGTNSNWHWEPLGQIWFAANIQGIFNAPMTGIYNFSLTSDDGSKLFLDNRLAVDNGGSHPPTLVSSNIFLTAGGHPLELNFFNCCGVFKDGFYGKSGVDLTQSFAPVPEPSTWLLLLTGFGSAFIALRYRRRGQQDFPLA